MVRTIDFFIVGAGKSGTSALHEYLQAHPDIFMPAEKEINYFGSDLIWLNDRKNITNTPIETHLARFSGWKGEGRVGEASAGYLLSTQAPNEIKDFNPDAKIIIMLRNPIDAMYAAFYQNRYGGQEHLDDFRMALAAEEGRLQHRNLPPQARLLQALCYRSAYNYTEKVARYFDVFGRNSVHVIIFDDFKANTARVYHETLDFLGAANNHTLDFKVVNQNKAIRSAALRDYFKRTPPPIPVRLARWMIPYAVRRSVTHTIRQANTHYSKRPAMSDDLRAELRRTLTEEVEHLSILLGRDLSHWVTEHST